MKFLLLVCVLAGVGAARQERKNVLLLIADDLRPQLRLPYGQSMMHTPNLDQLSTEALTFDQAYSNFAICSPSRNSFLSGRRPDFTRVWNFLNDFRQGGSTGSTTGSDWVTLPELFKNANYTTLGLGKLYHPNMPPNNDQPRSWSQEQPYVPLTTTECELAKLGERFCPEVKDDSQFSDFNTTMSAIDTLRTYGTKFKQGGKPFFIGLGLHFPHQSWAVPQWTVDQYETPPAPPLNPHTPLHAPDIATSAELDGNMNLTINETNPAFHQPNASGLTTFICPNPESNAVPLWFQQQLRLGYYSAVTHTDWMFGQVLSVLDEIGARNDTLVVVLGDHGWQLGEHAQWGKHTNWDLALQVPLIIRAPWKRESIGKHTHSVTELLDLYRTIANLAGIGNTVARDVDGDDVSLLFDDPEQNLKSSAFAQYSRCPQAGHPQWYLNNCEYLPARTIGSMGYTVRTPDWRYTEWFVWNQTNCRAEFDAASLGAELYSHVGHKPHPVDFDAWENENVIDQHPSEAARLRAMLLEHFDIEETVGLGCPPDPEPDTVVGSCNQRGRLHYFDADAKVDTCIRGKLSRLGNACDTDDDCRVG